MKVRLLTPDDADAYLTYRCEMWPVNSAAGDWETVCIKYFHNPLALLCPGSGLYGCFEGNYLLGVWGAYPMPISLDGVTYPGHSLVDAFVLGRCQNLPVGGILFRTLQNLPGRKYASYGRDYIQKQLARVSMRIESMESLAIWKFLPALAVKLLKLNAFRQPCPINFGSLELSPGVKVIDPAALLPEEPTDLAGTAFVRRDATFWTYYCRHRIKNAGVPLAVRTANAEAQLVTRLEQVGRIRMATILSVRVFPNTEDAAREVGRAVRAALSVIGVCATMATEPDSVFRALQNSIGRHVRRRTVHWWSIPRNTDTFEASAVKWRLTQADRDSHWGFIQPSNVYAAT